MANLKDASKRFASLLQSEADERRKPNEAVVLLNDHLEAIREARTLKISHARIAAILTESGVKASTELVRSFCLSKLKEIPAKRKKRRKRTSKQKAIPKAEPVKSPTNGPAIRVLAKDNENRGTRGSARPTKAGFRSATDDDL